MSEEEEGEEITPDFRNCGGLPPHRHGSFGEFWVATSRRIKSTKKGVGETSVRRPDRTIEEFTRREPNRRKCSFRLRISVATSPTIYGA